VARALTLQMARKSARAYQFETVAGVGVASGYRLATSDKDDGTPVALKFLPAERAWRLPKKFRPFPPLGHIRHPT